MTMKQQAQLKEKSNTAASSTAEEFAPHKEGNLESVEVVWT